jgi:NAD(P)-dependent dehydrogenase (short-subunit alcohol dehydrogenase family)
MTTLLDNKIALITGGAVGIGRAAALIFAREGAKVVVVDILATEGEQTVQLVKQNGGEARFIQCDVTQSAQVAALVQETVKAYGRLDCAFNNAGIEGAFAATADCTEENWDRIVAVDLKGVWLCMKYELQQMLTQGKGAIVNTASVAGVVAERGRPAYAAAKGGVIQLSRTAAIEYAGTGIRINTVCPGGVETPMIDRALNDMNIEGFAPNPKRSKWATRATNWMLQSRPVQKRMMNFMHPIGRMGKPEEIAEAAVWLCSDASSFITGHSLVVDGGMTAA